MTESKWWMRPQRVLQPILTQDQGATDMRALVSQAKRENYTALLVNVGGMFAWYPTKIPFHEHPAGMRGDPLGETIAKAREEGLKVMARFDLSGLREDAYRAKPQWFYQGRDGKPMIDKGFYATCLSTSFLEEFFYPMFDEVLEKYPIDGVFFNMFGYRDTDRQGAYHGPCGCPSCRKRFFEYAGRNLPAGPSDEGWDKYLAFKESMFEQAALTVYRRVKAKNPNIAFLDGRGPRAAHSLSLGLGDVAELELHWTTPNPRSLPAAPEYGWPYTAGECIRAVRSLKGEETPFSVMVNAFQCGAGRLIGHSEGWNRYVTAQAIANGAWPYIAFTGKPWEYGERGRDSLNALLKRMADADESLTGLRPVSQTLLVSSDSALRSDRDGAYLGAFRGIYAALVRTHQEFDILDAALILDAERLKPYAQVILPPIPACSDAFCAAVDEYVKGGGKAIVFGCAAMRNASGEERAEPPFRSVGIEAIRARRKLKNAFLWAGDEARTRYIVVNGEFLYASVPEGAKAELPLTGEIEYASPEQESMPASSGWPGLVRNRWGEGETAYIPWELPRLSHLYAQEDHMALLSDIVSDVPGGRFLRTNAPACVEISAQYQKSTDSYIVQLVNASGRNGLEFREPLPIREIAVELRDPDCAEATDESGGELQSAREGEYVRYTLPEMRLYALIRIRRRKGSVEK